MDRRVALTRAAVPVAGAITVFIIALAARLMAVNALPIDFDEDDYLRAGQQYATGFQAGDAGVLLDENYRTEHPPLTKILIGLALTPLPAVDEIPDRPTTAPQADDLPEPHLTVARTVEAVFGALAALALATLSPIGGLWLAVHTWSIKYTSQVMLEAVPAFFALAAVLAWVRALGRRRRRGTAAGGGDLDRGDLDVGLLSAGAGGGPGVGGLGTWGRGGTAWLVTAAVCFGLACAGKYLYGVAGLAIAVDWLWRTRPDPWRRPAALARWVAPVAGWGLLALAVFFLASPYLWPDPVGRLWASISYHGGYAGSEAVQETGWPSWQPLVWLMGSVPFHEAGTFPLVVDLPITILAVVGLRRMWQRQRVFALWLALALLFLVAWPTKWPQYLLVLSAPLSLAAGYGTRIALEPVGRWLRSAGDRMRVGGRREGADLGAGDGSGRSGRGGVRDGLRELRRATPWLLPGVIGFALFALIPLGYEALMSLTDLRLLSLRDGLQGGIIREAVGGVSGQIPAVPFNLDRESNKVAYVGADLLIGVQQGFWLGGNSSAMFPAFSLLWMGLSVGLQATLGVAVALVLERPGMRFTTAWRTLFILPWAIPEVVGAVAWRDMVHPQQGLLAQLVGSPVTWNASPDASLLVLLLASVWMGFPLWMLVATAGLRTIPRPVLEAANLDGAGRWRSFRDVTLPLLLPLLAAAFVIRGIAAFNQFYLFVVLEPAEATTTLSTFSYFIFDSTRGAGLYAVSAAINVMTIVGLAVVVVWFLRWRSRAERVAFA